MRIASRLPVLLMGILLAGIGYGMLWTTMMVYDDEGYVLYSLRTFCEGGGLYDRVFSQYGPFFFFWNRLLAFGGFDFSNTAARVVTLIYWLIASGAGAAFVARLTRSALAATAALAGIFFHLWPMVSEPSHPGGMICAVIALVAWLGTDDRLPPRSRGAIIGAASAALILTKINVGVFLAVSCCLWWILSADSRPGRRAGRIAAVILIAALPVLVMRPLLGESWVRIFALVAAGAGAGVILALPSRHESHVPLSSLWTGVLAGGVVLLLSVGFIHLTGTSWSGLLEGVLWGPLGHPGAYSSAVRWRPGAASLAIISLLLLWWASRLPPARRFPLVFAVRMTVATIYLLCWSNILPLDIHAFALSYGLTSTAWFVLPAREDDPTAGRRGWIALLATAQALHAFPVAGSQISWGTFLWIPLTATGCHDICQVAATRWSWLPQSRLRFAAPIVVAGLILVTSGRFAHLVTKRFESSDPLRLPGASHLYLPESFTSTLRVLALNSVAHADPLFSLPGMLSFHGWTGVPPPTTRNATHWFTLLSPEQQEQIRLQLEASPRACVIVQRNVYDFLVRQRIATETELTRWLHASFQPAFSLETYEFWVRKDRTIAALGTARARESSSAASARYRVQATLADPRVRGVASITLDQFDGDGSSRRQIWDATNASVEVTPLNSAGAARGPAEPASWPFSAPQLARIDLFTDVFPPDFRPGISILHFRDAAGRVLAEARFLD